MTYANEHLWLEKHGKLLLDVLYSQIFFIAIWCWLLPIRSSFRFKHVDFFPLTQDDMKMLDIRFL